MLPLSVVIITKNEAQNIARSLKPIIGLTDDILVVDSGSTDGTQEIASTFGARVLNVTWEGYAATKNLANQHANYDWILSLDADEEMTASLISEIVSLFSQPMNLSLAYAIQRKMVYSGKVLEHGSVSKEFRTRLFHRSSAYWDGELVHESLLFSQPTTEIKMQGFLWHHSYQTELAHRERLKYYADLSAKNMYSKKVKSTWVKRQVSPIFHFIKNFIFKSGFLDGYEGYLFARNEMQYVKNKYQLLRSFYKTRPFLGKS